MKQRIFLFIILVLFSISLHAQSDQHIQTREQNQKWLWDLEVLTLKEQIDKIQKRILSDSAAYHVKGNLRTDYDAVGIRPLYIIDGIPLTICRGTTPEVYLQLIEILNSVKRIKFLQGMQATSLYGTAGGAGGVIQMQTDSNKNEIALRKLNLMDIFECK